MEPVFSAILIARPTAVTDRQTPDMKPSPDAPLLLESLLQPENELEKYLLTLPEFQVGLRWGEPRFGHPEGVVAYHVRDVLDNIDLIRNLSAPDRERLRLIALTHDTFKYAEDRSRPRDWTRHHGVLARRFLEKYTDDSIVLDIIESHDDAFYAWLGARPGHTAPGARTLVSLLHRVGHCLQLYYLFFKCDTQTGDKIQASLKWFEKNVLGIEYVPVREGGHESG